VIQNNPLLESLHGLDDVISIGGKLYVIADAALMNLDGLDRADLWVQENANLTSVRGLRSLKTVGGEFAFVRQNPQLPQCAADAVGAQFVDFQGDFSALANDANGVCN